MSALAALLAFAAVPAAAAAVAPVPWTATWLAPVQRSTPNSTCPIPISIGRC